MLTFLFSSGPAFSVLAAEQVECLVILPPFRAPWADGARNVGELQVGKM